MNKNRTGLNRVLFAVRIRLYVFIYVVIKIIHGKIPAFRGIKILQRLEYFLKHMQENKFAVLDGKTRVALYVPGVPSRAFTTSVNKFTVFNDKLPCTTVLMSVTSACAFSCPHCYQKNDRGRDVAIDLLTDAARYLQSSGIAFFNIEGGEPFKVYDRLLALCKAIDDRSEIWVNATGYGMTHDRLTELRQNGLTAIMFPLHHHKKERMNSFMGSDTAWDTIHKGIALCHETEIPAALNMCLERDHFFDGTFEACMVHAHQIGISYIQIIKPKPAGGWLGGGASVFSEDDLRTVKHKVVRYNRSRKYAMYPAISAQIMEEDCSLFGCTAGGTDRFYINAKGDVQPCEFLNVSFGNIQHESFENIYMRMREQFKSGCTDWLCEKYAGAVEKIFNEQRLKTLPLPVDNSKELMKTWDRGRATPLYARLEK